MKAEKIYILGFIEKVKYGAISFVFGSVRSPSILPISSFSQNETQAIKQKDKRVKSLSYDNLLQKSLSHHNLLR